MKSRTFCQILVLLFALAHSNISQAGIHLSLSGSVQESNAGYQKLNSGTGSVGISFDIGGYTRIGYSVKQEIDRTTGYEANAAGTEYIYFEKNAVVTSNAMDLILILYSGDVFTPFIFAGYVRKMYSTSIKDAKGSIISYSYPSDGPQGGVGFEVRLSQAFSLKTTYTMSNGYSIVPGGELRRTLDSNTQVGISYKI